jgi:hypothetical protein
VQSGFTRPVVILTFIGIMAGMTLPYYLFMDSSHSPVGRVFTSVLLFYQLLLIFVLVLIKTSYPSLVERAGKGGLFCSAWLLFALVAGQNNYTGMIAEYRSGIYDRFQENRYSRYKLLNEASRSSLEYKYAEVPERFTPEIYIYTAVDRFQETVNDPNRVLEFYYGLDEVKFKSDSFSKCHILSQIICTE